MSRTWKDRPIRVRLEDPERPWHSQENHSHGPRVRRVNLPEPEEYIITVIGYSTPCAPPVLDCNLYACTCPKQHVSTRQEVQVRRTRTYVYLTEEWDGVCDLDRPARQRVHKSYKTYPDQCVHDDTNSTPYSKRESWERMGKEVRKVTLTGPARARERNILKRWEEQTRNRRWVSIDEGLEEPSAVEVLEWDIDDSYDLPTRRRKYSARMR